jgi:hypothetical protein
MTQKLPVYLGQVLLPGQVHDPRRWVAIRAESAEEAAFLVLRKQGQPPNTISWVVDVARPGVPTHPDGSPLYAVSYFFRSVEKPEADNEEET